MRNAVPLARLFVAALLVLGAVPWAMAHEYKLGPLTIVHPSSRATPPGADVAAGYVTIVNAGAEPDRLLAATAQGVGKVKLHRMSEANGVMTMRPVEGGIAIPAGATVKLEPGGNHLMMMGLAAPLKEGDRLPGTLTFEKAGEIAVEFAVGPLGGGARPMAGHDMQGM